MRHAQKNKGKTAELYDSAERCDPDLQAQAACKQGLAWRLPGPPSPPPPHPTTHTHTHRRDLADLSALTSICIPLPKKPCARISLLQIPTRFVS